MNLASATCRIAVPAKAGYVAGTGFIMGGLIYTCAHVLVGAGINFSIKTPVDLLYPGETEPQIGHLVAWGSSGTGVDDWAVLRPAIEFRPTERLFWAAQWGLGHPFQAFGYPALWPQGNNTKGQIGDIDGVGLIQLQCDQLGFEIRGGFSGAPVWDPLVGAVVGIVSGEDKDRNAGRRVGFMVPFNRIIQSDERLAPSSAQRRFNAHYYQWTQENIATDAERELATAYLIAALSRTQDDENGRHWIYQCLGALGHRRGLAVLRRAAETEAPWAQVGVRDGLLQFGLGAN